MIPQYAYAFDHIENRATEPVAEKENADAPSSLNLFYAFDGNKNVSDVFYRMTSNGIGAHYDYAPFGGTTRTHSDSSASFDIVALNPFRFSSEYYDSELDLVYYNYRHYSPSLGRFLSRDPIEEQGGLNLYASAGSVDWGSPEKEVGLHRTADVFPFEDAVALDRVCGGNGKYVKMYYDVRPSW